MSEVFDAIVSREKQVFMPMVRSWPVALERGFGSRVWDVEGSEFIDLTAGWGVTAIGHCHPELAEIGRALVRSGTGSQQHGSDCHWFRHWRWDHY